MTQYTKGRSFENYVKAKLEREGWWVCRSAGSKGKADLVAILPGTSHLPADVKLIQCKAGDRKISGAEKDALIELARTLRVDAAVAFKDKSGRVVVQTVES